jgi:hypothetical protein
MADGDKRSLEEAIEHFGVRGMKWGSRKAHNDSSNKSYFTRKKVIGGLVVLKVLDIVGGLILSTSFTKSPVTGPIIKQGEIAANKVLLSLTKPSRSGVYKISNF